MVSPCHSRTTVPISKGRAALNLFISCSHALGCCQHRKASNFRPFFCRTPHIGSVMHGDSVGEDTGSHLLVPDCVWLPNRPACWQACSRVKDNWIRGRMPSWRSRQRRPMLKQGISLMETKSELSDAQTSPKTIGVAAGSRGGYYKRHPFWHRPSKASG